ncbi:MAG TPA: TIGR00282 family metallophosphoesterase [Magnetospirillaceae bacterium]|nr:TIGR00282 family metallophosphoesterase [Magnetospirillaceae bacterium]
MTVLKVLYLGDIMGSPGREVITFRLPGLRHKLKADIVIAQAENVSHGKSMTPAHMRELQRAGVDFFTGGNHTIERPSLLGLLADPFEPVTAPMNQPGVEPDWGVKILPTAQGDVLVMSVLGTTFPELAAPIGNPLRAMDAALRAVDGQKFIAKIVNFHGDYSSEKRVAGFYLDGRVSAVVGDHWHVPTADAMVLPGGTAHITDVGMCGTLLTSLGVSKELIIARWRDGVKNKNDIALHGPYQLNGVLIEVDTKTGLARKITPVNEILEKLG